MAKNVIIGQSGGPTAVINSSLAGVYKAACSLGADKVYGMKYGIEGLLKEELVELNVLLDDRLSIELLKRTPSSYLGSCRYKLPEPEADSTPYVKLFTLFDKYDICAVFYIGGNDSMDTIGKLADYGAHIGSDIRFIGVPKTIDNDLTHTDHTPGYGSAAKYIGTTIKELVRDSTIYDLKSVTIVEIMGRNAGWLTASSVVLHANGEVAPHLIYVPERKFSIEQFLEDTRQQMAKHKAVIIAISEGVADPEAAAFQSGVTDEFGHKYLSGIGKYLEQVVREQIGCKVRSIELNVMQRCSSHLCSKTDIDESVQIGAAGVRAALAGETGIVMTFRRVSDQPYAIVVKSTSAANIANQERFLPPAYINDAGNNITEAAWSYFLPLIQGECNIRLHNGLPVHFKMQESVLK